MPKHHTEDYKLSAVNHYLTKTKNYTKTCKEFGCSRVSLKRWVKRYEKDSSIKRYNRKPVSYKITKVQVDYALKLLKDNKQITMLALSKLVKEKYPSFNVSIRQLNNVIRDNNRTRKRTRHKHFPTMKYKKPIDKKKELEKFYKEVAQYPINKIISLDETSVKPLMMKEYSRCMIGRRCVVKSSDNYVFRKFTLLVAISNSKCVGYNLYKEGAMTKERFLEFLQKNIFGKYKNHLLILDNARCHNNDLVKEAIFKSGNKYLFSVPYSPETNVIEMFFNQFKHYLKLTNKVLKYDELTKEVTVSIGKVKKQNYKNYFNYAYKKKKITTPIVKQRLRKAKVYKG